MHMFFVLNDEQQPLIKSDLCTLQMFSTPIHGLMVQEKALIVLFDVNMSTQVHRGAY